MLQSLLQTDYWAKFKESGGWRAEKYAGTFGLTRILPLGKSITYFPEIALDESLSKILDEIKSRPKPGRIFTRLEFLELWTPERASRLISRGLVKAFEDVQPEYRQWIFLDKNEDELLKAMKPKGRYNVNLAKKHQLTVEWGINDRSIQALFELYRQTAQRADFQGRDLAYFQRLATALKEHGVGDIVVVFKDSQPLSALLISFYGGIASYLYGGSGGDRTLMAPYLAHWTAILEARKRKMAIYDLLAVAPPDNDRHPHVGLTRFKSQFGGQTVRLLGSWDLVQSRIWYTIYRFVERRRRKTVS